MKWHQKSFEELTTLELYEILRLRSEVFVVEQNCVYQDIDEQDKNAIHLFLWDQEICIAYARVFLTSSVYTESASIGRVVVKKEIRSQNLGNELMNRAVEIIYQESEKSKITISAQYHLIQFYQDLGFQSQGNTYLEDGIPHIKMVRKIN